MKTYGLSYKGSKDKIAEKICSLFPQKENFYDLFMGGGSITHYQLLQNKYKNYYANDLNSLVTKAFDMAIHGKFKNETRWISHEEFDRLKTTDPYVAFCFSFVYKIKDVNKRRLKVQQFMKRNEIGYDSPIEVSVKTMNLLQNENRLESLNSIARLENVERLSTLNRLHTNGNLQSLLRLESCQQLASIERLEIYNKSYDEIEIKPNSVIYLDPPYRDTDKYEISKDFDYEKFYYKLGKKDVTL